MKKILLSALGLTIVPLIGYLITKSRKKATKGESKLYVGI